MLTENTDREIRMGTTLFGVHKDDIDIDLNGADARSFASQGQQRSISLAMKLAEGEISKNESGDYPVFLFDDVLSELDNKRKEYLLGGLSGKQVIITTCEEQVKKEGINLIYAENGVYRQI
jgi:DNA replication and repair protein RecF